MRTWFLVMVASLLATPGFAQQEPPRVVPDEPVEVKTPVVEGPHDSTGAEVAEKPTDPAPEVAEKPAEVAEKPADPAQPETDGAETAEAARVADDTAEILQAVQESEGETDDLETAAQEAPSDSSDEELSELPSAAPGASKLPTPEELAEMDRLEADLADESDVPASSDADVLAKQEQFRVFLQHVRGLEVMSTLKSEAEQSISKIKGVFPGAKKHRRTFSKEGMFSLAPAVDDPVWTVAVRLFEDGKCKDALKQIEGIAAAKTASDEARFGIARIQMCAGQGATARETLKTLANGTGAVATAARVRLGLKDDASAAEDAGQDDEGQYLSQLLDAAKIRARKSPDQAIADLDALHGSLKQSWDKYRVRLAQAEILEAAGRIDEAGAAYLELYRKTRGWKVNDSIEDRIETLERKHKKTFLTYGERIDRMRHLVARGRYKEAKQVSIENAKLRKVGGKEVSGWTKFRLALQAEREKDRAKAVKLFEEADKLVADKEVRPRIYFGWARALRRTNQDTAAIGLYERLCKEYPDQQLCEESLYEAGRLLQYQDKHAQALAKFDEVIQKHGDGDFVADAVWRSAFSHYLLGQYDDAIVHLERLRTEFGDLRDESELSLALKATYWIGVSHLKAGHRAKAQKVLQETIDRGMLTWYGRLAATRMKSEGWSPDVPMPDGRLTAADLEELSSLMVPEHPRLEQAALLVRLGFYQDALKELRTQVAVYPVPDGANRMLSAILLARGDAQRAHWNMKKFIDESGPNDLTLRDWGTAFPLAYMELAHKYGEKAGVSPFLVQAIMRQESGFRPTVKSWAGAMGLMQLMPGTANWTAKTFMETGKFNRRDLLDPEKNVRLGSMYIRVHTAHASDRVSLALAGYNAGAGALESWFKRYGDRELDAFVESITYQEARGYVRKVMTSYITYSALYGGQLLEIPVEMPKSLGKWGQIPEVENRKNISSIPFVAAPLALK
ncbi:MAG: transglycosylase SLT domain-containing protein [bacterium]